MDSLPDPNIIANELVEELQDALEQLQELRKIWGIKGNDLIT